VLADVVCQLAGVQTLQILHASVELAVGGSVLVLVLVHFINNLRHNLVFFGISIILLGQLHRVAESRLFFRSDCECKVTQNINAKQ
jgi:hypothetical protein